jgi:hypothetical protein
MKYVAQEYHTHQNERTKEPRTKQMNKSEKAYRNNRQHARGKSWIVKGEKS